YGQTNFTDTDLNAGLGMHHPKISREIDFRMPDAALEIHVRDLGVPQPMNDELTHAAFNIERIHRLSLRLIESDFGLPYSTVKMHPVDLKACHVQMRFGHARRNIEIERN